LKLKIYPVYSDKVPAKVITEPDMLFLGVDDRWTRLAITNLRVQANKPYINLGFYGWEAAYMLVLPHRTACWACLWRPDDAEKVEKLKREGKCPEPEPNIPGAVTPASIQQLVGFAAGEAVKFFTGKGRLIQYYKFNVQTGESEKRFLDSPDFFKPDIDCPICGQRDEIDVSRIRRNK
jgi:molybdopterin/thiamine biosynthesis adenylyltransferase